MKPTYNKSLKAILGSELKCFSHNPIQFSKIILRCCIIKIVKKNLSNHKQTNKLNSDRNSEQEITYRGLLFELSDIELRICAFESGLPIDVSTRNYSITEDGDSDSDISGLTKKIIKSNIPTADKLILINNRKEALHGAQTLSMILIIL